MADNRLIIAANSAGDSSFVSPIDDDLFVVSHVGDDALASKIESPMRVTAQMGSSIDLKTVIEHTSDVTVAAHYLMQADGSGRIILHSGGGIVIE